MNPKLEQLLQSRKFWTATLILAASLGLWELGEISGEQLATLMVVSGGIYMGSVALEDGLAAALTVWMSAAGPRQPGLSVKGEVLSGEGDKG